MPECRSSGYETSPLLNRFIKNLIHLTCLACASYGLKFPAKGGSMRKLVLLVFALMSFSGVLSAQSVDEIIAKSISATGGLEKIKAVTSSRRTGAFDAGQEQIGFVEVTKRPNKLRRDITVQGLDLVQAYDGQNGWQIVPFTGKKDAEPMSGEEIKA